MTQGLPPHHPRRPPWNLVSVANSQESRMNRIIYLVGLVVIVLFIAGYFGLR